MINAKTNQIAPSILSLPSNKEKNLLLLLSSKPRAQPTLKKKKKESLSNKKRHFLSPSSSLTRELETERPPANSTTRGSMPIVHEMWKHEEPAINYQSSYTKTSTQLKRFEPFSFFCEKCIIGYPHFWPSPLSNDPTKIRKFFSGKGILSTTTLFFYVQTTASIFRHFTFNHLY